MKNKVMPREGMPTECIHCKAPLHPKSEFYCKKACAEAFAVEKGSSGPVFLSKWKLRKRRLLNDPMASLRQATRNKTRKLIKRGKLKRKPCLVCGVHEVIAHHEDYLNPLRIIWICEPHHKDYHEGKITLFDGTLKWDPARLTPKLPAHRRNTQPGQKKKMVAHSLKSGTCRDKPSEPSAAPL